MYLQVDSKGGKRRKVADKELSRKPKRPVRFETDDTTEDTDEDDKPVKTKKPPKTSTKPKKTRSDSSRESSREATPEPVSDVDSDDVYKPPKDYKSSSRTHFSNALIRAGVKSTKDSSLEKEKQKSVREILSEKPVVRKTPGLLLQTAGKGLLNKAKDEPKENSDSNGLSSVKKSSGISFGLWGGHLPVERSIIGSSLSSSYDNKPLSDMSKDKKDEASKKVFSNWGGDFFKKNLDYRANTNRILEKLTKSAGSDQVNGSNSNGLS